jgi:hypothetical protein
MIIWLASYPRSGNTLTRTILKTCFDLNSHSDHLMNKVIGQESVAVVGEVGYGSDWPSFYEHARKSPELFFIKTHRPPLDDSPCIYIVRDGRSSLCSYHDFMGNFFPEARLSLLQIILGDDYNGDWSEHYAAWVRPNRRTLVLKFDQLPDAPPEVIQTIADFIGYQGLIKPWVNPLKELHARDPKFFREGKTTWTPPSSWTPLIDFIFWHRHGGLMQTLGYPGPAETSLSPECQGSLVMLNDLSNAWQRQKAELVKICNERQVVIDTLDKACTERLHALHAIQAAQTRPKAHRSFLSRFWAK